MAEGGMHLVSLGWADDYKDSEREDMEGKGNTTHMRILRNGGLSRASCLVTLHLQEIRRSGLKNLK
jgi:hypothetical protein